MRACTEPVRTGIGAVCVLSMVYLSGQLRCWTTQTSLVQNHVCFFLFLAPYTRTTRYEEVFCLKAKNGLGRFAPSDLPRYNGKCRLPCSVYCCRSGSGNCLTLFCFLLLFEQFVVVRIRLCLWLLSLFCFFSWLFVCSFFVRRLSRMQCTWVAGVRMDVLSYPVVWHDVALFTLLNALQCSVSMSNCCDHSVRICQMRNQHWH